MMEEVEQWRPVVGYEEIYEVSNFGRVKSLPRVVTRKDGYILEVVGTILVPALDPKYSILSLGKDRKYTTKKVHRLVMEVFIGKDSRPVNHKDFNRQNNRLDNLEYCTTQENSIHYHRANPKTSRLIGVCFDKIRNKWRASIHVDGKWISLGRHNSELEAHTARLSYEISLYGKVL